MSQTQNWSDRPTAAPARSAKSSGSASVSIELPIDGLAQVSPSRAEELRALGVATVADLLNYFPREYQYESEEKPIATLRDGEIGIARGEVIANNYIPAHGRPRFEATLSDASGKLVLVFFHGAYLRRHIHPGLILRARGPVLFYRGSPQMVNPKWEVIDEKAAPITQDKLRAIYPASARLESEKIERIISANLEAALKSVGEWFESSLLKRRKLLGRAEAYRAIHQPTDRSQAISARRRLVYDELMLMQLALGVSDQMARAKISAPIMRIDKTLDARIRQRFPFTLTQGQERAVWQIATDLKRGTPMKRLLQGDVGSGKTAVALYAMLVAVTNNMQAALLAPTEVLAEQHFLTLRNLLRESKVKIELLTSRTRRLSKGAIVRRLAEGEIHLAVGTQALLQEGIQFANLGLIVVDEQHRLGVRQRATLTDKGQSPHYLVMTATPIPRTLALSYFADFDVTSIDDLPPGRQPIQSRWLRPAQAEQAYEFIRTEAAAGRQTYIVLPQIDDDGDDNGKSVIRQIKILETGPLSGLRLAALHGRMSTDEKDRTMSDFRDGKIDVLIATTVIEVGIDVPNATVMLIDGAERFGLSQLHQLRGRVGRGPWPSHCILLADPATAEAEARLTALVSTNSGFEIAEMDLSLRGPGEFFGLRQHGMPEFKLADVTSELDLLRMARADALEILKGDPKLNRPVHRNLRAALLEQFGQTFELARIG